MQVSTLKNVHPCPRCGGTPILRRNSAKQFQIMCPQCEFRTGWRRKPDAIITWYNILIQYLKNAGEFPKAESTRKELNDEALPFLRK